MSSYNTLATASVNSNNVKKQNDTKNEAMFPLFHECIEVNIALREIRRV